MLSAIPIKIQANYFVDINKLIIKFIWKGKRPNTVFKEKNKVGRLTLHNIDTFYEAAVIKRLWLG